MIIGLCGRAGAGKDTVADTLCGAYGFQREKFAQPLYEMVSAMTGLTVEQLQCRKQKEAVIPAFGKSPRELLQSLGTDWGRDMVDSEVWIKSMDARTMARRSLGFSCVITDVRFDNEARWIRNNGGAVWEVVRADNLGHGCVGDACLHVSEAGVDPLLIDRTIVNDGTIYDLAKAVEKAAATPHRTLH